MNSSSSYTRYIDLNFVPDKERFLLGKYLVVKNPNSKLEGLSFLGSIAAESSTGTWTRVENDNKVNINVSGTVFRFDEINGIAEIAYPIDLFEPGNASQLLTVFAGNAFGLADVSSLKLLDIYLPSKYLAGFRGPQLGIDGIYSRFGLDQRVPLIGSIMKPKCGIGASDFAEIAFDAWMGDFENSKVDGVDYLKDDEALTSQTAFNCGFEDRIRRTIAASKRAEDKTGRKKIFVPNVTHSNVIESMRRAELVKKLGGDAIMIDYVIGGGSNLHTVREMNLGLIIHGHRTLFAALHRSKDFGIDYLVWAKLFRLIGGDQVHTGTPSLGVMSAKPSEVKKICATVRGDTTDSYSMAWSENGFKSCLPVCGAGLDPLTVEPLTQALGNEVAIFAGGGTHGHPGGTAQGASSLRAAVLALSEGLSISEFAKLKDWPWLNRAIEHFGKFDKQSPNDTARENM
jgi:ribulose-bisphosphate carboxylase large chain